MTTPNAEEGCEACSLTSGRIGLRLPNMGDDLAPTVFDEHHAEIARLRTSEGRLRGELVDAVRLLLQGSIELADDRAYEDWQAKVADFLAIRRLALSESAKDPNEEGR